MTATGAVVVGRSADEPLTIIVEAPVRHGDPPAPAAATTTHG
ncbi:hypothetical protein [Micromonospora sp. NPDC023956]